MKLQEVKVHIEIEKNISIKKQKLEGSKIE